MFRNAAENANAYTEDGRILQVEYALEASKGGSTSIGICTPHGVVLAAEKRPESKLLVANALEKIVKLDEHIACAMSGMMADARLLIDAARKICARNWRNHGTDMNIELMLETLSVLTMQFGEGAIDEENKSSSEEDDENDSPSSSSSEEHEDSDEEYGKRWTSSRPYGVALLFGGISKDQPQLWHMDASGEFGRHGIKAIGSDSKAAEKMLLDNYKPGMELNEAKTLAISTIQLIMGTRELDATKMDMMVVTKENLCHKLDPMELELELIRSQSGTEEKMETA